MLRKSAIAAVTVALAAGGAVLSVSPATAQLKEFRYSSWTPPPAPNNRFGSIPYFEAIEKELKGTPDEITFKNFMGAQLFNAFTTLAGVRDGAVDAGVTVPVYNAGELKAHNVIAQLQAPTSNGYAVAAASTETLLLGCPDCAADYAKNKTFSMGVYSSAPYHLMCNFEFKSVADLKGKKSAEGNPMFARLSAQIGMSRIQMGPADYLQALQRGTADCVYGPADWLNAFSLKDVVKTAVEDVTLGTVPAVSIMTVNQASWGKLSAKQREVFIKHYPDAVMRTTHGYYVDAERGKKDALAKGVKFIKLGPEFGKVWEDFRKKDPEIVAADAEKNGVTNAKKIAGAFIENIRKWEKVVDETGPDPAKLTDELRKRVYAKAKF
ncbi:MAG: TRAP transporter substrate-binding protein DctP [Xanthobacteraceae bacterium]